jgi:hypothetical protein
MLLFVGRSANKIFFTFVVLFVLIASIFTVQITHAADNSAHPRLYFNQSDLDYLGTLRSSPSHQAIWNNIKSWADAHIDDSPPNEPSSGGVWWQIADTITQHIETMGFMYAMTDDPAYANAAKNWMLSVSQWSAWGTGSNQSIAQYSSRIILGVCFGYDVLYDYLAPSECDAVRQAIITHTDFIVQLGYAENYPNMTAIRTGAVGVAALTLGDEYDEASSWLSYALDGAQLFLSYGGRDGGWFEGLSYGPYSMNGLIPFLDALKRVEGQDFFANNDFLRNTAYFYISLTYDGKPLQFEDCNWFEGYDSTELTFIYRLASEYNNGYAQQFANNYASQSSMQSYVWKAPNLTATPTTGLPLTKHFGDTGYVILRAGWGEDDLLFAFKSGSSRGHAHNSQNEFGIYYQGKPITCGPGYVCMEPEDDTWTHNCLLVDGKGQGQEPGDYKSLPLGTTGIIEQVDVHDPYYRYVLGDASAVYNGQSGNGDLDEWLRHVVFLEPSYFVIYDDVAASEAKQFDWLLQAPKVGSDTASISVTGNTITLLRDGVKLVVDVLEPASFAYSIIPYENPYGASSYIELHPVQNAANAQFLTVLFPLTANGSALNTEQVKMGNLIGAKVIDGSNLDLILFSADGNPVDEYIELGASYQAADDNVYTFDDTKILAHFDDYQVIRLERIFNIVPSLIVVSLILLAIVVLIIVIVLLRRKARY